MTESTSQPAPREPSELERCLATLDRYANGADVYCLVSAGAAKLLREMARDFDHFQEHQNDRYGACPRMDDPVSARCTCGLDEARERWRLPK